MKISKEKLVKALKKENVNKINLRFIELGNPSQYYLMGVCKDFDIDVKDVLEKPHKKTDLGTGQKGLTPELYASFGDNYKGD